MCVFEFSSIRVEDIVAQKVLIFLGSCYNEIITNGG